jgi:hypothetical protein
MQGELDELWRVVSNPSSTSAAVWAAWCRIREIMAEAADA